MCPFVIEVDSGRIEFRQYQGTLQNRLLLASSLPPGVEGRCQSFDRDDQVWCGRLVAGIRRVGVEVVAGPSAAARRRHGGFDFGETAELGGLRGAASGHRGVRASSISVGAGA